MTLLFLPNIGTRNSTGSPIFQESVPPTLRPEKRAPRWVLGWLPNVLPRPPSQPVGLLHGDPRVSGQAPRVRHLLGGPAKDFRPGRRGEEEDHFLSMLPKLVRDLFQAVCA